MKITILEALVNEGVLETTKADEWCANHTVKLEKKPFWRKLLARDKDKDTDKGYSLVVVKRV